MLCACAIVCVRVSWDKAATMLRAVGDVTPAGLCFSVYALLSENKGRQGRKEPLESCRSKQNTMFVQTLSSLVRPITLKHNGLITLIKCGVKLRFTQEI